MIKAYSHKTRKRFPLAVAACQVMAETKLHVPRLRQSPRGLTCEKCGEEFGFHPPHPIQTELTVLCTGEVIRV